MGINPSESARYDLFVSYAAEDQQWVDDYLLRRLKSARIRYQSEAMFTLGVPRIIEFERAVRESRRTLLVLSPAYLARVGDFVDVLAQAYGQQTSTWPVIPLLLHDVELPPRLSMLTSIDVRDPKNLQAGIRRLCEQLGRPFSRVCFISSEYPPRMVGGLGSHVEQLTTALGEYIDVDIVLPSVGSGLSDYQEPSCERVHLRDLPGSEPSYDDPVSWLGFAVDAADRIDSMIAEGVLLI